METALSDFLSHAPVFVRRLDGEILYWTQGAEELYGYSADQAIGRRSHDLLKTIFPGSLEEINARLRADGVWEGLLSHTRADGRSIWAQSRWRLRKAGDEHGWLVIESNTDVTEREYLSRELDHRVKNILAIVQGLYRLTWSAEDPGSPGKFEARLAALGSAHDLLLQHRWTSASLKEVIRTALEPFGTDARVELKGEDIELEPRAVVAYAMAFHELATNAVKHGALSASGGRVLIEWDLGGERGDQIYLVWRETGGPALAPERASGRGTKLLEQVVSSELGVPVILRFEPAGLVCEFDGPVQKETGLHDDT